MVKNLNFSSHQASWRLRASNLALFRSRSVWLFVVAAELRSDQRQIGEAGAIGDHLMDGGDELPSGYVNS